MNWAFCSAPGAFMPKWTTSPLLVFSWALNIAASPKTAIRPYAWFVPAFRDASEKLQAGDLTAKFPPGSFPPALPFVS